jgi:metallo-beta-lactamase family protein
MSKKISIQFLGAAGTVTGSKYLISFGKRKIMVDCGLFQGLKQLRLMNWDFLPVNVPEIDAVLLTHGHLDHCGYLPRLIQYGFKGKIFATGPTIEVTKIILKDSAKIQEEEAERANRNGYTRHKPAMPLYTLKDAEKTSGFFNEVKEGAWIDLFEDVKVRFQYNGHIIGACFIELKIGGKSLVFSGDIGRSSDVLMNNPKRPEFADAVFIESTYGDRLHSDHSIEKKLTEVILRTFEKKGSLIIPSFAVERTQSLMYYLWQLRKKKLIPPIPIYMDSPMGKSVLEVFHDYPDWHKLSLDECSRMSEEINKVGSYQETQAIVEDPEPKIVIAGSGMITGGRVLTYLEKYLSDPSSTVLLVGYQAEGTRGRQLLGGAAELKIYGKYCKVNASVELLEGMSGHADQKELLDWLSQLKNKPEKVFIVHGEPQASDVLRVKIQDTYGWNCFIPSLYQIAEL